MDMEFKGYLRENGQYGVRNHIVVMCSVNCASGVVHAINRALPEVVPIINNYGCGSAGSDASIMMRTLAGIANNPNIAGVLIIGLGCEGLGADRIANAINGKPVESLIIQKDGGSAAVTKKGIEVAQRLLSQVATQTRVPVPIADLVIGLECGGSDAFSGITANPALGAAADLFVQAGATTILSETTEMIGTAHILKRRAASPEIGKQVEKLVNDQEKKVRQALGVFAGMVIAPGNIEGGLSSITEKSLGCIEKGGTTPINEIVGYGSRPSKRGLIIMDTPGYDIDSMAGLAAGGAHIILFTTGRGTPAGFPGVPVIKISSNSTTFKNMPGDIDINAGIIIDEDKTITQVGEEIYNLTIDVANGKLTCAEKNLSIPFNYLKEGPTF
jgi:altronate dehydratase large subunit